MRLIDLCRFTARSLTSVRLRTALMLVAMSIGVASVVVLTSLGEGARQYVTGKFSALGTNLLIVLPGRSETTGAAPPLLGETPRDLTLEDARALLRSPTLRDMAPLVVGNAPVSWRERQREVSVLGTTASFLAIRRITVQSGRFLTGGAPDLARPECVLGVKLARELFGTGSPLGELIRIGDRRFRVIGITAPAGVSIGVDLDDIAIVPVVSAQQLFNTNSLFRILAEGRDRQAIGAARQAIVDIIRDRHDGENDVTIITQDAVLATFDRIFTALTLTVGGIAAISLLVAGILVMNVMLIAVSQRTGEIGLLKALGAPAREILVLFLGEALLLSVLGSALGSLAAAVSLALLQRLFPDFPLQVAPWALAAATAVALATGAVFAILPARRAARLEPVAALARR
ncbi:MAG: ABC transporter permease [Thermodesulfobacteriota bacterium]